MTVTVKDFGTTPAGDVVKQVIIENAAGHQLGLISYGASWQFFRAKEGTQYRDMVAGFHSVADYIDHPYYLGNNIGRIAGRIDGASFEMNGKTYNVDKNEGENHLHGGFKSFADRNWDVEVDEANNAVKFTTVMREEEDGFPGTMETSIVYSLDDDNNVRLDFSASSDQDTVFNPTSHAYFNPAGMGDDANDLDLYLAAPRRLEMREDLIPTGKKLETAGTAYDFMTPARIGDKIAEIESDAYDKRFDEPFEIVYEAGAPAAILTDPKSGRAIEVRTERNAMIFFITNPAMLDPKYAGDEEWFKTHPFNAVALEAQTLPDSMHNPEFGDVTLPAGETQTYTTVYTFKNI